MDSEPVLVKSGSFGCDIDEIAKTDPERAKRLCKEIKMREARENFKGVPQVKVFIDEFCTDHQDHSDALVERVNAWLIENKDIKNIRIETSTVTSGTGEGRTDTVLTITVHFTY